MSTRAVTTVSRCCATCLSTRPWIECETDWSLRQRHAMPPRRSNYLLLPYMLLQIRRDHLLRDLGGLADIPRLPCRSCRALFRMPSSVGHTR